MKVRVSTRPISAATMSSLSSATRLASVPAILSLLVLTLLPVAESRTTARRSSGIPSFVPTIRSKVSATTRMATSGAITSAAAAFCPCSRMQTLYPSAASMSSLSLSSLPMSSCSISSSSHRSRGAGLWQRHDDRRVDARNQRVAMSPLYHTADSDCTSDDSRSEQQHHHHHENNGNDYDNVVTFLPPSDMSSTDRTYDYDVVICGAGPGGLLLASQLKRRGHVVAVLDPNLSKPWPNNYGVWMDEAIEYGYANDCIDHVWNRVGIVFDETSPSLTLTRPYGRIDRKAMKSRLLKECSDNQGGDNNNNNNNNNGDNASQQRQGRCDFCIAKATDVRHFDNGSPSVVTIIGNTITKKGQIETETNIKSDAEVDDTNEKEKEKKRQNQKEFQLRALLVVDATGFARKFVKHNGVFDPGYQNTFGARYRVKSLGPYQLDKMILMDYSERHLHNDKRMVESNNRFPSFVYVMPLSNNEIFLEETVLVSRPAAPHSELKRRLEKRMGALGIVPIETLEEERAAIPMGGIDPIIPQRTLGFGATSSLVHPASGYMVARAMELAPRVADAVGPGLNKLKHALEKDIEEKREEKPFSSSFSSFPSSSSSSSSHSKPAITGAEYDAISQAGWDAIWPTDERRQRDFMHFGFELLCLLSPQELRDFFTGFFRLPNALWEHFLSWRLTGWGHVVMGITVWATCIPRRFMPSMLIKSLPFLGNTLVGPFLSRGNFAPVDLGELYYDANGNSTKWKPEEYYSRDYRHHQTNDTFTSHPNLTLIPTPIPMRIDRQG